MFGERVVEVARNRVLRVAGAIGAAILVTTVLRSVGHKSSPPQYGGWHDLDPKYLEDTPPEVAS